jgi:hypothetical protein
MSVRSGRGRRDGENGHEEEMKKREKEIDEGRKDNLPKARIRSSAKNLFLSNIEALAPGRFIISPWK